METDPKGQLGGLECTDDVRRRMAKASQVWKCPSCAKSNLEILKECEEAAKKADNVKPDEAVPKELKMGWKDEMTGSPSPESGTKAGPSGDDVESAELAEGFVATRNVMDEGRGLPQTVLYPPAQPVQGVPQPTAAVPVQEVQQQQAALQLQRPRNSNDGVPEWVDKAIAGIVACLVIMILKMILL